MKARELKEELIKILAASDMVKGVGQTGNISAELIPGKSDIDLFVICTEIPTREERKAYYKDALIRLGESEELINCIESSDPIAELKNLVVEKNNIIKELRRANDLINICNKYSGDDLKNFKDLTAKHASNVEVEKLKLEITLLRKKLKQYESE